MKAIRYMLLPVLVMCWMTGCQVKDDTLAFDLPDTVTFNRDIAPIVFHNCTPCHRPGEAGPFPFTNYAQVKKGAR
ncbi:MAG: hypothetical protein H6585_03335 [Flavobacteriales bacterium]|nr:hypothetical protein [Flavobacteriales bacterium]MCB9447361.1 hypothetical protein [Flavobacteriales bacterium]